MSNRSRDDLAKLYCESICEEVRALEILLAGGGSVDSHCQVDPSDQADSQITNEMLAEMATVSDESVETYVPLVADYLDHYCLEVVILGRFSVAVGEWEITGLELVRTIGGPNAYVITDDQRMRVEVYWGSQVAEKILYCPETTKQLGELFDY